MKKLNALILFLFVCFIGCEEEAEPVICSCTTTVTAADGTLISSVNSAEEAPISDNCLDLLSTVTDTVTGVTTQVFCQ